jgi:hypothetical protein
MARGNFAQNNRNERELLKYPMSKKPSLTEMIQAEKARLKERAFQRSLLIGEENKGLNQKLPTDEPKESEIEGMHLICKHCGYEWNYTPKLNRRKNNPQIYRPYTTCPVCKSMVRKS